ncbi:O-antigen ligase family protein [Sabulibacter ruber]|uniref:O-antigen ligase family protein n=1 Tax=Sabulibacter ruber TaxID=2811901 RepID=UPI001A968E0B|nr:O-antigen ligase family protein [Sabulibacter ruber]
MKVTFSSKISLSYCVVVCSIITLLFSGFIKNFLSPSFLNLGTLLVDLLIVFQLIHIILVFTFFYIYGRKIDREYLLIAAFWAFLLLLTLGKIFFVDENSIKERISGLRNNLFYCLPVIYIPLLFQKERYISRSIHILLGAGLILCLYAIFQYTFASSLPLSFLAPKGEGAFMFYQQEIIRPTALVGNTIIFASLTLFLFCLVFTKYITHKKKVYLLFLCLILTANILTFTRATMIGFFLSGSVILVLYYGRFTLLYTIKLFAITSILLSVLLVLGFQYKDTFIVKRLTGREASTISSNEGHFSMIDNSIIYLKKHYLAGSGVGSQGPSGDPENVIITDGYWFQMFLENGVPLGILYLLFYVFCLLYALQVLFKTNSILLKQLCLAFLGVSVYFYAASFINSAFIGRVNFILYWILFGLIMALRLITKRNPNAVLSH